MRILIVEDQPKTGDYLKQGLSQAGFNVDVAIEGREGLHLALTERYDLVI
ncbi:response regulator, partial [Bacillus pumilus]